MADFRPILLAEDNPKDVELTLEALAENNLANRVILDIKMPRMDGIEVLRAIRADAALKVIPVVMLTSSREEQDLVRSYELGTNAYVVKPVKFSEFVLAVKQLGVFWAMLNELPPEGAPANERGK